VGFCIESDQVRRYLSGTLLGRRDHLLEWRRPHVWSAIENEVHAIFQEHGGLLEQEVTTYLKEMIHEGLLCEDQAYEYKR
jgi:hypothetical protein